MLYIEQIPRKEGEPFYTTELTDIQEIQKWCALNCDTSKRHVITRTRMGGVIAEGLAIPAYYGYNHYTKKPIFTVLNQAKTLYQGYKVFNTESEALNYYLESEREATKTLESHAVDVNAALIVLRNKGINFGAWATCLDDQGLESGLGVSCIVNGFYFHKQID